jgi:Holliday junction resolvasome RuvABC ATP-dependent DNA helicase subunit
VSSNPRLVTPQPRDEDADASLRPQRLADFLGQEQETNA